MLERVVDAAVGQTLKMWSKNSMKKNALKYASMCVPFLHIYNCRGS